jgi:23S rRNA (uracil1939-C5)-methyltransferase
VDPPKGLSTEAAEQIARLGVRRLVYVSDDAARLARDLPMLARHGFVLDYAQAVDMMPNTPFVDSIALLSRA